MRGFLSPHLEDRFEVLGYLRHRGGRHVREHVALEVDDAPLPVHPRQLAPDSGLYPLVVVAYHQTYPTQAPVDEPPKQRGVGLSLLRAGHLHCQDLPKALLVHSYAGQKRHASDPRSPPNLQVGGVQIEIGIALLLKRALSPFFLLLFEARGDAAHRVLADPHLAQRVGDAGYLAHRDPREIHLKDRLLNVAGHPLVALEDLGDELTFPVSRHFQALDLACRGHEVALVVAVALSSPGRSELPVAGFEVLGHLLLENLFEDDLHALADSGLYVQLHVMLELVLLRGQVPPFSLNPQPIRHYLLRQIVVRIPPLLTGERRVSQKPSFLVHLQLPVYGVLGACLVRGRIGSIEPEIDFSWRREGGPVLA